MELVILGIYDIEQNLSKINYLETIVLLKKDYEKKLQKYMFATVEVPILQTQKRSGTLLISNNHCLSISTTYSSSISSILT